MRPLPTCPYEVWEGASHEILILIVEPGSLFGRRPTIRETAAIGVEGETELQGDRVVSGYAFARSAVINQYRSADFPQIDGVTIGRVSAKPGGSPAYVRMKDDEWLYVRLGNSTRRLSTREAVEYIRQHWGM